MKLIFLDIDGVLNTTQTQILAGKRGGLIGMQPDLVQRFNQLVERTGAKVVLSSTWRLSKTWRKDMRENGLTMEFLDRTPHMPLLGGVESMERGKEIKAWLDAHPLIKCDTPTSCPPPTRAMCNGHKVEAYAILDDDSDMLPDQPHFKTSFYDGGLTEEIAAAVEKHLATVMHT